MDLHDQSHSSTFNKISRYLPLALWLAFIFVASTGEFAASHTGVWIEKPLHWLFPSLSPHALAACHMFIRKAAHFTEYGILGWLSGRAFSTSPNDRVNRSWFFGAFLLVSLYAFSDEYHQSFVPSRTASVYDSLLDISGGLTVLIIYWLRRRRKRIRAMPHRSSKLADDLA